MNEAPYRVPASFGEAEFTEKRSRFIGRVWPVAAEGEALAHIAHMRESHWDATHNVYAYTIRKGPTRYSDDGEPQGTSALPALSVFQNEGISNFCCVITRYYGGILLGSGGLVRAYSKAAKLALDAAGTSEIRRWDVTLIACPYPFYEAVKRVVENYGVVEATDFGAEVMIEACIRVENTAECIRRILDVTAGAVEPVVTDTVFRGMK